MLIVIATHLDQPNRSHPILTTVCRKYDSVELTHHSPLTQKNHRESVNEEKVIDLKDEVLNIDSLYQC